MRFQTMVSVLIVVVLAFPASWAYATGASDSHSVMITVEEIAALHVGGPSPELVVTVPGSPGEKPVGDIDDSGYLSYTSTVAGRIVAAAQNEIPPGMVLRLAVDGNMTGSGDTGEPAGEVVLGSSEKEVITGIGSTAVEEAGLLYTLDVEDVAELSGGSSHTVEVMFTLLSD